MRKKKKGEIVARVTAKDMIKSKKFFGFALPIHEARLFIFFCKENKLRPCTFLKKEIQNKMIDFQKECKKNGKMCQGNIQSDLFD